MQNIYLEEFKQSGVYEIRNKINDKRYIGSTTMTFTKRLEHHRCLLKNGTHKNIHLQRAWDKYGEDNFDFNILEVVDICCTLEVEQTYIDECEDCYNINPLASGTPNMSRETIDKRSKSFTLFIKEAMTYYYKVKKGDIYITDVPEKFHKTINARLDFKAWNKGKDSTEVNYSYLRVPKTITESVRESQKNNSTRLRENSPNIFVYDISLNFLGCCYEGTMDGFKFFEWYQVDEVNNTDWVINAPVRWMEIPY